MAKAKQKETARRIRPALTPETRENQLVSLAVDLAEKQLLEGTASSQVITHYLKLGSTKEQLEKEKLKRENELLKAKAESLQSAQRVEELYRNALNAMRNYSGNGEFND
jgi:cell division protein FtsB